MIHSRARISKLAAVDDDVSIGRGTVIHPFVTILAGARIGEDCEIFSGAVIGRPPRATAAIARAPEAAPTVTIGDGVVIGANAVIYQQVQIGTGTLVGDQASIREQVRIGARCIIGTGVTIQYEVEIADEVRIMNQTHITGRSSIGAGAFVGLHVATSNDGKLADRLARDGEGGGYAYDPATVRGVVIGERAFIGSGASLLPGITIGARAIVGAHALVTRDVVPGVTVMGVPAQLVLGEAADPKTADTVQPALQQGETVHRRRAGRA